MQSSKINELEGNQESIKPWIIYDQHWGEEKSHSGGEDNRQVHEEADFGLEFW